MTKGEEQVNVFFKDNWRETMWEIFKFKKKSDEKSKKQPELMSAPPPPAPPAPPPFDEGVVTASGKYVRKKTYPVEEIMSLMDGETIQTFEGCTVKMRNQKHAMFAEKGTSCVVCGLKGEFFALERDKNLGASVLRNKKNIRRYQFNLYGKKDEKEILLTKDHIIPRSMGGKDSVHNYQPMCQICNLEKGNKLETEVEIEKEYDKEIKDFWYVYKFCAKCNRFERDPAHFEVCPICGIHCSQKEVARKITYGTNWKYLPFFYTIDKIVYELKKTSKHPRKLIQVFDRVSSLDKPL